MDSQTLDSFFQLLKLHIDLPIETPAETYDISCKETSDLEKTLPYKAKKTCSALILKLLRISKMKSSPFSKLFNEIYSTEYFQSFIMLLLKKKQYIITPKLFLSALKYLRFVLNFKEKKVLTLENYNNILFEILIPTLYITKADEDLWNEDPQEYICRQEDESFLFNRIKLTALQTIELILQMNEGYLRTFIQFTIESFENKASQCSTKCLLKEALIRILGFLKEIILDNKLLSVQIEEILKNYIFPEFTSPIGFLRMRTCWIFQEFDFLQFADKNFVNAVIENIANCLMDPQIPVIYMACVNLNEITEDDIVRKKLKPILPRILELILNIMDKIDNEEIVFSLESIIESFKEDITPFALELLQHLKNAFFKYNCSEKQKSCIFSMEEEEEDKEEEKTFEEKKPKAHENRKEKKNENNKKKTKAKEEESDMAAYRCLEAIKTILSTNLPDQTYLFSSLFIADILNFCLKQDASDYLKQGLEILSLLNKGMKTLPDEILFYFPIIFNICGDSSGVCIENWESLEILSNEQKDLLVDSLKGWAGTEYLESVVCCIASFIGKIQGEIFQRKDLFNRSFIELISKLCDQRKGKDTDDYEAVMLLHLYVIILENCHEVSNEFIGFLINACMEEVLSQKSKEIKMKAIEIVCAFLSIFFDFSYKF